MAVSAKAFIGRIRLRLSIAVFRPKASGKGFNLALAGLAPRGVRPREISRLLTRLKREAFDNDNRRFRRFLREAHYTRLEIRERVMVQILAEKIHGRVIAGVRPGEESQAFNKFVKEYEERWQSRTVCAEVT
jgi:hypothetical protein